jgi:hypothetical protein
MNQHLWFLLNKHKQICKFLVLKQTPDVLIPLHQRMIAWWMVNRIIEITLLMIHCQVFQQQYQTRNPLQLVYDDKNQKNFHN